MATDTSAGIEPEAAEATEAAYITPTADFVVLLALACLVSLVGVAVIIP